MLVGGQRPAKRRSRDGDDEALGRTPRQTKGAPPVGGNFYEPTVLGGVTPSMRVYQEEQFGPIIPLIKFRDEAEAVRMANDTPYG